MKARMYEETFGRKNMHADRQTDRQTFGRTDRRTNGRPHTNCKHINASIDERTHVRSNIWALVHARGQTDRQTDGWTHA